MEIKGKATKKSGHTKKTQTPLEAARAKRAEARGTLGSVVFQLADGKQATQIISARCIASIDGVQTALRYVPGVKYILESEQGDLAGLKPKAIIMRQGKIVASDKVLIEYLRLHPKNKDNGGSLFYEYNAIKEAEQDLELEMIRDEAKYIAVKGIDEEKAYAIAKVIKTPNVEHLSDAEIRRDLRTYASSHPREFMDLVESPEPEINALVSQAFSDGRLVFTNRGNTLAWDGGGSITELPPLKPDARLPYIVRWMMTDKAGAETLEVLKG